MIRSALALMIALGVAACGDTTAQRPRAAGGVAIAPPVVRAPTGLDRVIGKDARSLTQLFGSPVQDVQEDNARKLQFASSDCILDAYLYASAKGREPVVTYVSARTPDGRDAERQSCVSALAKRR